MDKAESSRVDHEEFERLVKPLVDFLQTKCHPHMSVIVEWDFGDACRRPTWRWLQSARLRGDKAGCGLSVRRLIIEPVIAFGGYFK